MNLQGVNFDNNRDTLRPEASRSLMKQLPR
jgi:hypothetical protein